MSEVAVAPIAAVNPPVANPPAASAGPVATPAMIHAMLHCGKGVSDLILSPGRPPQVEVSGRLAAVPIAGLPLLRPEDTTRIAGDLIGGNKQALQTLRDDGACDLSHSLPGQARFRVNIF